MFAAQQKENHTKRFLPMVVHHGAQATLITLHAMFLSAEKLAFCAIFFKRIQRRKFPS